MRKNHKVAKKDQKNSSLNALTPPSQWELPGMTVMSLLQHGSALLLKQAIAEEISVYLGRGHYEHSLTSSENKGYRNGYQRTLIDTPIGQLIYDRTKLTGATDFKSQYHSPHVRRPEEFAASICDMYVNGVSTRKVKDSLKAVAGEKVRLSKSTISRITKKLREEFRNWQKRDLSQLKVAYLFLDAIRVGMRMGGTNKDAVLIAYAILQDGTLEVLSIDLSQSETLRSWGKFINDLKARGLMDPLLVCSDGNSGVISAIDSNFPQSYRQRCVKHKSENILDAIAEQDKNVISEKLSQIFYGATSLEQAKLFVKKFVKEFSKKYPTAISRFQTDLDQCLTFYLFPSNHWRRIRTSNKLERLNKEIRRRLKVIGRHPDENGCLSLIYHVTTKYAQRQLGFKTDDLTHALWKKLREEKIAMIQQLELDLYVS